MSIDEIPLSSDLPYYAIDVELGGRDYSLTLSWNTRDERWYLSIATGEGVALLSGIPIVVGTSLTGRFADERLPRGQLIAVDGTGVGGDPTRDDLGDRVRLIFVPYGEEA